MVSGGSGGGTTTGPLLPDGTCDWTNLFGLTQYDGQCDFFGGEAALPQGLGWFVVGGLGAIFALVTSFMVWLDDRYSGRVESTEEFATAGRSIKVGLTACDIVSKWTWAATLLQSSNVAYKFGVSGPFWYAAGATIQVLLFSILAVEVKRKAPQVHTVLEVIKARWGRSAHAVFMYFVVACNIIVTSMLILGGSAVIEALTGVPTEACAFLIPVGVAIYTAHGGLRATFIASWSHVAIIYIALCIFTFIIYASNDELGSPARVWEHLRAQEAKNPVAKNYSGSYLTMLSESGLIFGIINIIGNFGTVFCDQAYWQSAIAARPTATYKGYLLGGLSWFSIPFTLATSLGLAGRALDLPITIAESDAGLTPPAVAVHLLGRGGAFLMVLQLFMAVTAAGSAEQIAVSSLAAYDIYKEYINPKATGQQVVFVSRVMVIVYSVLSGCFALILLEFGLSLGWVYLFMGIMIGSAVFPIAASITWAKCSRVAAITGAVVACPLAVMTWLVTAATLNDGKVDLKTTGQDYPMLAGNLVALLVSSIICVTLSYIWPQDYNWTDMLHIPTIEVDGASLLEPGEMEKLTQVLKWTYKTGGALSAVLLIVWPLLALPAKVFPKGYWTFWVIIAIVWGLAGSAVCIILPLWEAKEAIWMNTKSILTCAPKAPPQVTTPEGSVKADMSVDAKALELEAAKA